MAAAAASKLSPVSWCKSFIKLNVPSLSSREVTISNIYLRDNSRSTASLNPRSQQRLHLIKNIDLNVHPVSAEITRGDSLKVIWSDKDESEYKFDWIRDNVLRKEMVAKLAKQSWSADEMSREKVELSYNDVMNSDDALS